MGAGIAAVSGMNARKRFSAAKAACSSSTTACADPLMPAATAGPPSSSWVRSSPIAADTTGGPDSARAESGVITT